MNSMPSCLSDLCNLSKWRYNGFPVAGGCGGGKVCGGCNECINGSLYEAKKRRAQLNSSLADATHDDDIGGIVAYRDVQLL